MKNRLFMLLCLLLFAGYSMANEKVIRISTDRVSLIYKVAPNGRLYQVYLGKQLTQDSDIAYLPEMGEAYLTHGMEDYYEPAIRMLHNDGNPSLLLKYVSHETKQTAPDVRETVIRLRDENYPVEVNLFFIAYAKQDIIKTYTEIKHAEKKPVTLYNYASSLLHLSADHYFLTEFSGDWAHEVNMTELPLAYGKKLLDTKLGSRADMFCSPFFLLSLDRKAEENNGDVLFGTISWTGNFRFTFEVDHLNKLRILSGINPYASEYALQPNEVFRTPEFVFTYSAEGKGLATRNFHRWARNYDLKDGNKPRMTLLNNWEATYFDFDENKLVTIMDEAVKLGVDMFLLDDGWFGNKYPRSSDRQGLGDWDVTKDKLPNGVGKLVEEAQKRNIKFGIWIEPEMVNPKSELYEKHKDWVIHLSNRDEYYFRNQLVLDLSNPKVQDYVFSIVDNLMTRYPGIAYFKWDCNSPITNIYSPYLKDKQSHLYVDHVRGVYNVFKRVNEKYPNLPMMLCSGGGGRSDFEALKYFTEFWPSDNTDPVERIFIQWGFSHFFPVKSMAAHVTSWGKQPLKFRTDVAMMCKLGFDIRVNEMTEEEQTFCHDAVKNFKRLNDVVLEGDMYRLVSPYEKEHAAMAYVNEKKDHAVLFAFDIYPRYAEQNQPVKMQGLDPQANYKVEEINLMPGTSSRLRGNGQVYSGEFLMTVGLPVFSSRSTTSHILEITRR
ncbi:MAG: alpha-galactosidase [Massilibacteroides sp.]|nr:alpha-galactosidase [Massilibacteroides sp.]MDD3061267.1 alpha-galactosidase [Massilibacteroides sp.]MDD4114615.1 alpha-galactosidase [Massilibacteroides sp.]MDD4659764.1 alpha-galactosidase [Massilibacteroides sp.]